MVILEPWMQEEVKQYEEGRRKLAQLMNEDPESFSETQVTVCISQQTHSRWCSDSVKATVSMTIVLLCLLQEALQYLLPSRLTAKDARPFLKVH